jgi:hypothetical protein
MVLTPFYAQIGFAGFAAGVVLGVFYKVYILVPSIAGILILGPLASHGLGYDWATIALQAILAIFMLELGYLFQSIMKIPNESGRRARRPGARRH